MDGDLARVASGDARAGSAADAARVTPRDGLSATLHADDLSEYLIYITCPICEEVVNDPVFTRCHHTFCRECIERHILVDRNDRCPECRSRVLLNELENNSVAVNLLNTFKTKCIYHASGCTWKGKMSDLTKHYKSCKFAVTSCPYGCDTKVEQQSLRKHMKECEFRPVNDCPCRTTFAFNRREEHQKRCLNYLQVNLPKTQAEVRSLQAKLKDRESASEQMIMDHAQLSAQTTASTVNAFLLWLAVVATMGQLVRPDATLSLALYLIVGIQSRQPESLGQSYTLLATSLAAEFGWLLTLSPIAGLLASPLVDDAAAICVQSATEALVPFGQLAYFSVAFMFKLVLFVPQRPLFQTFHTLADVERGRRPLTPAPSPLRDAWTHAGGWLTDALQFVGKILFIASSWSCVFRPDAGAMLALLVLTAMRESQLYFSRIAAGAALLTLFVDWRWLLQAVLPGKDVPSLLRFLFSPSELAALHNTLPLPLRLALSSTLVTVPLKLLVLLLIIGIMCLPHVAKQQKFHFEFLEDNVAVLDELSKGTAQANGSDANSASKLRAARRRFERDVEALLAGSKRVVTLCFVGWLLSAAIGSMHVLTAMSPLEPFVLTMLAAYGCLRHSKLCESQPQRCCALIDKALAVILPSVVAASLRLAWSESLRIPWESIGVVERISLVCMAASVLMLLLLAISLLHMRWLLLSLQQPEMQTIKNKQQTLVTRLQAASFAGLVLSFLLSSESPSADPALFMLALFILSAEDELDAWATLVGTKRAQHSLDVNGPNGYRGLSDRLRLSCLAPNPKRRAGGLMSVSALVALAFCADILGYLSLISRSSHSAIGLILLGRALLKLGFVIISTQLLLLRCRILSSDQVSENESGGGILFVSGAFLVLLAIVSSVLHILLTILVPATEQSVTFHISTGAMSVLGVLACAVAMRSGGSFLAGFVSIVSIGIFLAGMLCLSVGPSRLTWEGLVIIMEGALPVSLAELLPYEQMEVLVMLIQLLITFCIGITTFFYWACSKCWNVSPTSSPVVLV